MTVRIRYQFVPQPGPQMAFIRCPADIVIYGGSRGGGKTFASLGEFWLHSEVHGDNARGLMIRRTREDLKDTHAVAEVMYGSAAKWVEKGSYFRFANGARLYFAYLENDADAAHYQGWNLTRLYIEELTQFPSPTPVMRLLATLRSSAGIKCQMRCTCNPGGPGHAWVKAWVIDAMPPFKIVTDPETGITRAFVPAKLTDNPALLNSDPTYINRLKAVGSPQLVRAWLEGDWNVVEGAFFPEFTHARHVVPWFPPRPDWLRFRSADWGSARPFSIDWWAVVDDDYQVEPGRIMPRGSIYLYRSWYGARPGATNEGLKLTAEEVAHGILTREAGETITYGVLDPAAFAVISGPSVGETLNTNGAWFRRAENSRVAVGVKTGPRRWGGWDQVRQRLKGDPDGRPMMFFADTCRDMIRLFPLAQHDPERLEDMDTEIEDHALDSCRYACLSRPFIPQPEILADKNPLLVKNAMLSILEQ